MSNTSVPAMAALVGASECSSVGGLWLERFGALPQLHPGVEEGQHPRAELWNRSCDFLCRGGETITLLVGYWRTPKQLWERKERDFMLVCWVWYCLIQVDCWQCFPSGVLCFYHCSSQSICRFAIKLENSHFPGTALQLITPLCVVISFLSSPLSYASKLTGKVSVHCSYHCSTLLSPKKYGMSLNDSFPLLQLSFCGNVHSELVGHFTAALQLEVFFQIKNECIILWDYRYVPCRHDVIVGRAVLSHAQPFIFGFLVLAFDSRNAFGQFWNYFRVHRNTLHCAHANVVEWWIQLFFCCALHLIKDGHWAVVGLHFSCCLVSL